MAFDLMTRSGGVAGREHSFTAGASRVASQAMLLFALLFIALFAAGPAAAQSQVTVNGARSGVGWNDQNYYPNAGVLYGETPSNGTGYELAYFTFAVPANRVFDSAELSYNYWQYSGAAHTITFVLLNGTPSTDGGGQATVRNATAIATRTSTAGSDITLGSNVLNRINSLSAAGGGTLVIGAWAPQGVDYFGEFTSATLNGVAPVPPTITSLNPSAGPTTGTTASLQGTNFENPTLTVDGVSVTPNTTTTTAITFNLPAHAAGPVPVTVTTIGGTATATFTYVNPPTVTAIAPQAGPTAGGTSVVITGTGFSGLSGASAVRFGSANATQYTVNSATQITAVAPANAPGVYDVRVTTPGGTSAISAADKFTYVAAPTVTAISPNAGPTAGGTSVTITGAGFSGAPAAGAVRFGAASATYTVNSDTQITATSPANSAGVYDITVTTPGGTSATSTADRFTYVAAPTVTSVSPNAGSPTGGQSVTITGTGFSAANATGAVSFGGTAATYTINSNTQITATSPARTAGTINIQVATPGGTSAASAANQFTYAASPVATSQTYGSIIAYNEGSNLTTGIDLSFYLSGGGAPTSYAVGSATTAQGGSVTVNSAGQATYTPPVGYRSANDSFTWTASNQGGTSSTATLTVTIGNPTLAVTLPSVTATVGTAYNSGATALEFSGGRATYSVTGISGLPNGMTFNAGTRVLSGTPTVAGTYTLNFTTTDSSLGAGPFTATVSAVLTISAPPAPVASSSTIGTLAYNSGGAAPTVFSVAGQASNSPTNYAVTSAQTVRGGSVSISNAGLVTYTAPVGVRGNDSFGWTASNAGGTSNTATVTIPLGDPTFSGALPAASGTVGTPYNGGGAAVTVTGGVGPYSGFSASGLPAGLTMSSSGVISGTPTTAVNATVIVTLTDSSTGTGAFTSSFSAPLSITAPSISLSPAAGSLPGAQAGVAYAQSLTAAGGISPYTYGVTAGALPLGLTLQNGAIAGTPTGSGTFNFTVTATDSSGNAYSGSAAYSLTVGAPTIVVSPTALPGATVNVFFSQTLTASGGTAGYSFALDGGALPDGVTLSAAGVLSGTPTEAGAFPITIRATDATTGGTYSGTRSLVLTVGQGAQTITFDVLGTASLSASPLTLAATATSGLAVTFTSETGAVCTVAGSSLTLVQTGTCTIRAEQAGNTAWSAATPASRSFTVTPAHLALGAAPASGQQVGADYSQANTATGGVAPYAYALNAGALPPGVSLDAATGLVSGTPTVAGAFSYQLRVTDAQAVPVTAIGPIISVMIARGVQTVSFTSAAPAPATVPGPDYTATASATSGLTVEIRLAPSSTGCVLTGSTVHFTGAGSCILNADQAGDSNWNPAPQAQQSFVVNLSPPVVADVSGIFVSYNSGGSRIDLSNAISGGAHTSVSITSGPAHGALSVSGDVVTYTPTAGYFGPDSFSFAATGPGGTSSPATVSLTVAAPPPPVVTPPTDPVVVTPPAGGGVQPVTVDLSALSSGVFDDVRVGADGQNGSATISGDGSAGAPWTLTYTPAADFMGTDTVSVIASGPGGESAPAVFTFQVAGKAPDLTASTASNASVTISPTSGLVGGPFNAVRITRAPDFGTATVNGLDIVFTPGVANGGATSLDYVIDLPFGSSATGRIDLVSNLVPGAQALTAETLQGVPVTVRISDTIGGPFSGAAVVSIDPADAGTATIAGSGAAWDLTFTPDGAFSGEATVTFSLTNSTGTTDGTLTIAVEARPDPSQSAEVRGVATAQVTSARRFADAQLNNFQRRLQALHDGTNDSSNGLSLNVGFGGQSDLDNDPRTALRRQLGVRDEVDPGARDDRSREMLGLDLWAGRNAGPQASTSGGDRLGAAPLVGGAGREGGSSVGFWTAGSVDWGRQDAQGQRDYRFTTQGVTAGLDVRVGDSLILGGGLGYGEDKTKIGDNGSVSEGSALTGALYASWRPAEAFYVDGVIGYADLDFDARRWAEGLGGQPDGYAMSERSGDVRFASAAFGRLLRGGGMTADLYARVDAREISLNGFTETGVGRAALVWDAVDQSSLSANLGAAWRWTVETRRFGRITPSARLEWSHELEDVGAQGVRYADWAASPTYLVPLDAWSRNAINLDLGAEWSLSDRMMLNLGYRANLGDASTSQGANIRLKYGW
ncbi:IPT/TIG domain-containing protein [Brevundimonas sp. GCM10030266]|uniref:IPT/TIG domain-containing protein n=1 Tax=Brevundimonas sp. GCM10030266 TaxID=3273386 RepID=UPI0036139481